MITKGEQNILLLEINRRFGEKKEQISTVSSAPDMRKLRRILVNFQNESAEIEATI